MGFMRPDEGSAAPLIDQWVNLGSLFRFRAQAVDITRLDKFKLTRGSCWLCAIIASISL
jgi:hypothetical protein